MKKGISMGIIGILMITLTACQGNVGERVAKKYQELESFTAHGVVTVNGNKGVSVYEMKQTYLAPDAYRMETVAPEHMVGTVFLSDGKDFWMKRGEEPGISVELNGEEKTDFFFPISFLREYFQGEETPFLTENEEGTVVLSAPVPNGNPYRFHQSVELSAKTCLPIRMMTYDQRGDEVLRVEYQDVMINTKVPEDTFLP